jgi:hypothetical protein
MAISSLRFDMRAPDFGEASRGELYAAALDMCEWADEKGFLSIALSEHHGVADGFMSSPLTMAGMVVGRTRKVMVAISALLVPLYEPLRLAEDLATLDIGSGGRVSVTAGLGYRPDEYAALNKEFKRRGKLMDECLEVLLKAWTGEPFEYRGATCVVTPVPVTQPHPMLFVGGSTAAAAKRAARFGLPFAPPLHAEDLNALYLSECERLGVESPFVIDPGEPMMTYFSEDPDATWKQIGPYLLHDAVTYASWQRSDQLSFQHSKSTTIDELRQEGKYRVLTPEQALAWADQQGPSAIFHNFPLGGGIPPKLGWKSLNLYADCVMPYLK